MSPFQHTVFFFFFESFFSGMFRIPKSESMKLDPRIKALCNWVIERKDRGLLVAVVEVRRGLNCAPWPPRAGVMDLKNK